MMIRIAIVASALIAAAAVAWTVSHGRRETTGRPIAPEDDVQPWDVPPDWRCTRCRATGLAPGPA